MKTTLQTLQKTLWNKLKLQNILCLMNLCLLRDYIVGIGVEYMNVLCACHVQHFTEKYAKYFIITYSF